MAVGRLGVALVQHRPRAGVSYPEALVVGGAGPSRRVLTGLGGPLLGLISFLVFTPALIMALVGLGWVLAGRPGEWAGFYRSALAFNEPVGVFATHLGLALLILIAVALVLVVHHFQPGWLASVQPGFRWRYGLAAVLVAFAVLGGLWALSRLGQPWEFAATGNLAWFLAAIVLTSPLQAAAEEVFFRGYLMQAFGTVLPGVRWFGLVTSALVFALLHGTQDLPLFLHRFAFGIIAGLLVILTGGLEAAIAAHVVNNLVAFSYAALSGTLAQAKAVTTASWVELGVNLVGFTLFALAAWGLARRMNLATRTPSV